jgi:hypothetical protein
MVKGKSFNVSNLKFKSTSRRQHNIPIFRIMTDSKIAACLFVGDLSSF